MKDKLALRFTFPGRRNSRSMFDSVHSGTVDWACRERCEPQLFHRAFRLRGWSWSNVQFSVGWIAVGMVLTVSAVAKG